MSNAFVQIAPDSTGKKIDNSLLTIDGNQVYRQRVEAYQGEPFAVTGSLTDIELRATPISVSGVLGSNDLVTDAWGIQKVSLPYSLFSGMFTFDVPQSKWMMYENGVQVYTSTRMVSESGAGKITADATVTIAIIESRVCPRYQSNRGHLFSTAGWMPNKTANGVREWGVGTQENRVIFRLKSDGLLYGVLRSGNVETKEVLLDTGMLTGFDVEKGNVYDIQFQWRGVGNYVFFINLREVGRFTNLGTLTALSMQNPALPVRFESTRITENVSIYTGCADITSENGTEAKLEYGAAYAANVSTGTNTPILVIKQPLLINGQTNTRDLTLARITLNCSKKATFRIWTTRDATAFTSGTFVSVNQGSYVECDSPDTKVGASRVTAVDVAKLRFITAANVEAAVPREIDNPWPDGIVFPIVRGDYVVVTCTASTATADCVIEWGEHI